MGTDDRRLAEFYMSMALVLQASHGEPLGWRLRFPWRLAASTEPEFASDFNRAPPRGVSAADQDSCLAQLWARLPEGALVLDLGSALGADSCALAREGFNPIGTDVWTSPELLPLHPPHSRPPAVCAKGEALPFRAESFDAVWDCETSSICPRPARLWTEALRALKPNGIYHWIGAVKRDASEMDLRKCWTMVGTEVVRMRRIDRDVLAALNDRSVAIPHLERLGDRFRMYEVTAVKNERTASQPVAALSELAQHCIPVWSDRQAFRLYEEAGLRLPMRAPTHEGSSS
ncbi:MAG: class I SAM-dependent methyltransferase [Acidimicrobiia bacterium]|nr:class I SAM-dependent methyltransferase [Acidimicrobiia bacterium]MBP8180212.1 class I SAM-dependent methyltransferase [Acidimicrobiia bacterium]